MRLNYKELIKFRVNYINEKLGTNYTTDYAAHYGGWSMYTVDPESGAHYCGPIGTRLRKSNREMLEYLDGIFQLLSFYNVTRKES